MEGEEGKGKRNELKAKKGKQDELKGKGKGKEKEKEKEIASLTEVSLHKLHGGVGKDESDEKLSSKDDGKWASRAGERLGG